MESEYRGRSFNSDFADWLSLMAEIDAKNRLDAEELFKMFEDKLPIKQIVLTTNPEPPSWMQEKCNLDQFKES